MPSAWFYASKDHVRLNGKPFFFSSGAVGSTGQWLRPHSAHSKPVQASLKGEHEPPQAGQSVQ